MANLISFLFIFLISQSFGMERNDKVSKEGMGKMSKNCDLVKMMATDHQHPETADYDADWNDIWLVDALSFSPAQNDHFFSDGMNSLKDDWECDLSAMKFDQNLADFGQPNAMAGDQQQSEQNDDILGTNDNNPIPSMKSNNLRQQFVMIPNPTWMGQEDTAKSGNSSQSSAQKEVPMMAKDTTAPSADQSADEGYNEEEEANAEPKHSSLSGIMGDLTLIPTDYQYTMSDQQQHQYNNDAQIMMQQDNNCTVSDGGEGRVTVKQPTHRSTELKQTIEHSRQKHARQKESKKVQKLQPLKRQKSSDKSQNGRNNWTIQRGDKPPIDQKNAIGNANGRKANGKAFEMEKRQIKANGKALAKEPTEKGQIEKPIGQQQKMPTAAQKKHIIHIFNFLRYVFDQSLNALGLWPQKFNHSMEILKKGGQMDEQNENFKLLMDQLEQTDTKKTFENLDLLWANAKKHKNFSIEISEIQAQTEFLFGHRIFSDGENAFNATHYKFHLNLMERTFGKQMNKFEIQTNEQNKRFGALRFFFCRLFRKLIGALEAPFNAEFYNGKMTNRREGQKENSERSDRETLLLWMNLAIKRLIGEQSQQNKRNNGKQQMTLFDILTELEEFDLIREGVELAQFTIQHTIDPLIEESDGSLLKLNAQCLLGKFQQILSGNIAQMILEKSREGNPLDQIKRTASESNQMNVSVIFLRLFNAEIGHWPNLENQTNDEEAKIVNRMIRNVQIYKNLYVKVILHLQVKGTEMGKKSEIIGKTLAILAHFLAKSVGQMDNLLAEWHSWQNEKK